MPTQKSLNPQPTSKEPRAQWEDTTSEKKRYLKRIAEDKETEKLMSDYFKHQFDGRDDA